MPDHSARLIWSLTSSNLGTTISAAGNSGTYQVPGPPPWSPNALSAVDLRRVDDIWIAVEAAAVGGTGSPSLTVSLGAFDDQGNLFAALVSVPALTASGAAGRQQVSAGRHGSAGNYNVFPEWGQVAWAVTGTLPVFTGVAISLWAR